MYSCSTLHSKYFRRCGPRKYKKGLNLEIKHGDHHVGLMKQTWIPVDHIHLQWLQCIFQPNVNFICTWTLKCIISGRKLHAVPFTLCYEFNLVHVKLPILKGDGQILFWNYYYIQCVWNYSAEPVVIFQL
jgi:hypothetical protein